MDEDTRADDARLAGRFNCSGCPKNEESERQVRQPTGAKIDAHRPKAAHLAASSRLADGKTMLGLQGQSAIGLATDGGNEIDAPFAAKLEGDDLEVRLGRSNGDMPTNRSRSGERHLL